MRTLSKEELQEILEKHKKWLTRKDGGERADLRGADFRLTNLRGANLRLADLRGADFRGADFRWAVFIKADFSEADFSEADLRGADLSGADLSGADFSGADLSGADLSEADLSGANFSEADLIGANFSEADLRGANFRGAYLSGANFRWADFSGANFRWANLIEADIYYPIACPESGSFIGYKSADGYIVKLRILEDAKRSSATSRKCRCDKAEVVAIENSDGTVASVDSVKSNHDRSFIYRIGEIASVDNFDDNRWNECTAGIHFFITRDEAVLYK